MKKEIKSGIKLKSCKNPTSCQSAHDIYDVNAILCDEIQQDVKLTTIQQKCLSDEIKCGIKLKPTQQKCLCDEIKRGIKIKTK
jgi:hypothetical protein